MYAVNLTHSSNRDTRSDVLGCNVSFSSLLGQKPLNGILLIYCSIHHYCGMTRKWKRRIFDVRFILSILPHIYSLPSKYIYSAYSLRTPPYFSFYSLDLNLVDESNSLALKGYYFVHKFLPGYLYSYIWPFNF